MIKCTLKGKAHMNYFDSLRSSVFCAIQSRYNINLTIGVRPLAHCIELQIKGQSVGIEQNY